MIPMPPRIAALPQYGDYPVPYTTLVVDGRPDFRATDLEKWMQCARHLLCGICGQKHKRRGRRRYEMWFVGGPNCMEHRQFFDLSMHEECARYAMGVCPFLLGRDYSSRELAPGTWVVDGISERRPARMGIARAGGYRILRQGERLTVRAEELGEVEWF